MRRRHSGLCQSFVDASGSKAVSRTYSGRRCGPYSLHRHSYGLPPLREHAHQLETRAVIIGGIFEVFESCESQSGLAHPKAFFEARRELNLLAT